MIDKQLPSEFYRIRTLFGDFGAAVWKRISTSEDKHAAFLKANKDVYPKTTEEIAAWNELTSPENREGLLQWVAYYGENVHDYAKRLNDALLADSDQRATAQQATTAADPQTMEPKTGSG
jgi:hypothetical protein